MTAVTGIVFPQVTALADLQHTWTDTQIQTHTHTHTQKKKDSPDGIALCCAPDMMLSVAHTPVCFGSSETKCDP